MMLLIAEVFLRQVAADFCTALLSSLANIMDSHRSTMACYFH